MPTLDETMEVLNVYSPPMYTSDEVEVADPEFCTKLLLPAAAPMYA